MAHWFHNRASGICTELRLANRFDETLTAVAAGVSRSPTEALAHLQILLGTCPDNTMGPESSTLQTHCGSKLPLRDLSRLSCELEEAASSES